MTFSPSHLVLFVTILFCRIGFCVMLLPGFSSPRIPLKVRLALALALTLTLTPFLAEEVRPALRDETPLLLAHLMISESLMGFFIGFSARIFFAALETTANAMAMMIGMTNVLGAPVNEEEPLPVLSALVTLSATVLLFIMDLHWEILRGLVGSYKAVPVIDHFNARLDLVQVADSLSKAFFLSFRLAGPFIIFSIIVNLAVGLINKMIPQIPIYFITMPFVLIGGLFLFFATSTQLFELFMFGFRAWLIRG
ncbi:flagellar biosynthetic protein FliR [Beijerinckia indica]|uniref:Flagellar biosynthesis protein FliR n=1 Tax=Beijerinckia indica subsp. indica (strain ATCC 9039 / DSM 1715 / NCIMB 8712) TaxID=395963 RepID=B2IG71_BEII9|nr:flagellar biosynthetic protein FliR [Beijerinckia indica]ACB97145.1 flagellar biosynthesis protein FliR [Beijerinckia indica subsp. indica ATCC 9039]